MKEKINKTLSQIKTEQLVKEVSDKYRLIRAKNRKKQRVVFLIVIAAIIAAYFMFK